MTKFIEKQFGLRSKWIEKLDESISKHDKIANEAINQVINSNGLQNPKLREKLKTKAEKEGGSYNRTLGKYTYRNQNIWGSNC